MPISGSAVALATPWTGTVSFTTSDLPVGSDQITAVYQPGGSAYPANTSAAIVQTIVIPTLYWYPQSGSDVWSATVANWNTSPDGTGTAEVWQPDDRASLAGATGTIFVEGGPIDANSIDFPTGGVTLASSGTGVLAIGADGTAPRSTRAACL